MPAKGPYPMTHAEAAFDQAVEQLLDADATERLPVQLDTLRRLFVAILGDTMVDGYNVGPFDADELVRYAEMYGHPEGWIKRAQGAHQRAENAEQYVSALRAAIWGALVHFRDGRDAQALSLLNSKIPDGYQPAAA